MKPEILVDRWHHCLFLFSLLFTHHKTINYRNLLWVVSPLSKSALLCFYKAMPSPNMPTPFQHCCTVTIPRFTSSHCNTMFCDSCLSGTLKIFKPSVKCRHSWHLFHGGWVLRISRFLDVIIAVVHLLRRPKGCEELGVNIFKCTVGKIYFLSYCCEFWGPDFLVW